PEVAEEARRQTRRDRDEGVVAALARAGLVAVAIEARHGDAGVEEREPRQLGSHADAADRVVLGKELADRGARQQRPRRGAELLAAQIGSAADALGREAVDAGAGAAVRGAEQAPSFAGDERQVADRE